MSHVGCVLVVEEVLELLGMGGVNITGGSVTVVREL